MPDPTDSRLQLSGIQNELYQALVARRADCAKMYLAAVVTLNDERLPERFVLSAHAFRELMEKLPAEEGAVDSNPDVQARIKKLVPHWETVCAERQSREGWGGSITDAIRGFLEAVQTFFATFESHAAGRRAETSRYLTSLDPATIGLPADIQKRNAKAWMDLRKFFNDVSHHLFPVDDPAFRASVSEFEAFLVARMNPRPTADFAAIDALLNED